MRGIRTFLIAAVINLTMAACAWAAEPVGLWDVAGKATATIQHSTGLYQTRPFKTYHQSRLEAVNISTSQGVLWYSNQALSTVGTWRQQNNSIQISYDLDTLNGTANATTPADFLLYLRNQFANAAVETGFLNAIPTHIVVSINAYEDSANINAKGVTLVGKNKVVALVTYHDAADTANSDSTDTATLTVQSGYKATKAAATSPCCSMDKTADENLTDSLSFLAANRAIPGVKATVSGLQYRIINPATAPVRAIRIRSMSGIGERCPVAQSSMGTGPRSPSRACSTGGPRG